MVHLGRHGSEALHVREEDGDLLSLLLGALIGLETFELGA